MEVKDIQEDHEGQPPEKGEEGKPLQVHEERELVLGSREVRGQGYTVEARKAIGTGQERSIGTGTQEAGRQ